MEHVDLFRYEDYRKFLKDWFIAKRRRPSMRSFAQRVGCSPALVSEVCSGHRLLEPRWQPLFVEHLRLDPQEHAYFDLLCELERCDSDEVRVVLRRRVAEVRRFRDASSIEDDRERLFGSWFHVAVAELASCKGFRADPAWIAAQLDPPITTEQAEEALRSLVEIGRLHDEGGEVRPVVEPWVTDHDDLNAHVGRRVAKHNAAMLELAARSMSEVPADRRHLASLTMPIPVSLLPELKRRIGMFMESMIDLCVAADDEPETVYQASVQLFPLSRHPDDDEP